MNDSAQYPPPAANFCGASGAPYRFERIEPPSDWSGMCGLVLFACTEGRGWRVVRVVAHDGAVETAPMLWREARMYGATTVFVHRSFDPAVRHQQAVDLERGLDPVCGSRALLDQLAA